MSMLPLQLGLIGYPLGHSLSPQLHHAALQAMDLPGNYQLFPILPLPEGQIALANLIDRLRRNELGGLNVTIPHKTNVLPLLDELTPMVRQTGSANTLFCHGGRLVGDTTDVPGFLADLEGWLPEADTQEKKALILGAGGSARAVAVALHSSGWQMAVAARRSVQIEELSATLGIHFEMLGLDSASLANLQKVNLIVNTTPLGMYPHDEGCPWPEDLPLPENAAVYDLIYNPSTTLLMKRSLATGLPTRNGLGMLVEQAALSLERWSGRRVPREAMWEAVQ